MKSCGYAEGGEIECPACGHKIPHGEEEAAEPEHKEEHKHKSFAEAVRARKKGK